MTAVADEYVEHLKREIEVETHRYRILESALGWSDAYREDMIRALTAFELATAPMADAPPVAVAMLRSDLARALRSVRRAGQVLKRLDADTTNLGAALKFLRAAIDALPSDLPKPKRRQT